MKTQMKFQKILAIITLVTAALAVVLSLLFCSGLLQAVIINSAEMNNGAAKWGVEGLYGFSQQINDTLVIMAIILLLTVVLVYAMGCNKRRNYYITNYIAIGVFAAMAFAFAIAMIYACANCFALIGEIDFEGWKAWDAELQWNETIGDYVLAHTPSYDGNVATLVLGILLSVLLIVEIVAWVLNLVWKIKLMKGEKALLAQGSVESTAEMEVA